MVLALEKECIKVERLDPFFSSCKNSSFFCKSLNFHLYSLNFHLYVYKGDAQKNKNTFWRSLSIPKPASVSIPFKLLNAPNTLAPGSPEEPFSE